MGAFDSSSWADMKIILTILVIGVLAAVAEADGQRRGRGGRQQGRRQRPRGGRQLNGGLGPPPQPVIDLPFEAAAPLHIPARDGNYDFEFETEDGSEYRREEGRVNANGANEISGEYSWTSPEGELVSFTYIADENGYQAQGSHLPEAPPLHPHIQRGLELIARVNARNQAKRNRAKLA